MIMLQNVQGEPCVAVYVRGRVYFDAAELLPNGLLSDLSDVNRDDLGEAEFHRRH